MFESIFIGTSGLIGFSKSLRVISNNLANVNTPGFKGSQLQFADFFYQNGGTHAQNFANGGGSGSAQYGAGLNTLGSQIDFRPGPPQSSANGTDVAINGNGFFILRDGDQQYFTRSGQFVPDGEGFLVSRTNGFRVQVFNANGKLSDFSVADLQYNPGKATTAVKFDGGIAADAASTSATVSFDFFEASGLTHRTSLSFSKNTTPAPGASSTWTATVIGTGAALGIPNTISFDSRGNILPTSSKLTLTYSINAMVQTAELDFSAAKLLSAGSTPLRFKSQNGFTAGILSQSSTFDAAGQFQAKYSNNQTIEGAVLALARFDSDQDIQQSGGSLFTSTNAANVEFGRAGTGLFGKISPGSIEGSNVDLAQEFSNLIVAQRGYQASSRVVSTANELVQELFDMKGRN